MASDVETDSPSEASWSSMREQGWRPWTSPLTHRSDQIAAAASSPRRRSASRKRSWSSASESTSIETMVIVCGDRSAPVAD